MYKLLSHPLSFLRLAYVFSMQHLWTAFLALMKMPLKQFMYQRKGKSLKIHDIYVCDTRLERSLNNFKKHNSRFWF